MDTLLPFALLCFTSFFTLTNPLGTMPVFLTMTHGMTDKERQAVVRRATFVSFITLMVFVFAGQFLFKFFGISTNGFRIAGGVIIFKIGFDMLQARYTPMKLKDEEIKTYADEGNANWHYCFDLFYYFSDIARFYPIGQSVGRNGKQCDDAFDGAYPDGDCSRVFC